MPACMNTLDPVSMKLGPTRDRHIQALKQHHIIHVPACMNTLDPVSHTAMKLGPTRDRHIQALKQHHIIHLQANNTHHVINIGERAEVEKRGTLSLCPTKIRARTTREAHKKWIRCMAPIIIITWAWLVSLRHLGVA